MSHRVLITGITGFLGSHLAQHFVKQGNEVTGVIRQQSDLIRLRRLEKQIRLIDSSQLLDPHDIRIDTVIHTACHYGKKKNTLREVLEANILLGLDVVEFATKAGATSFINTHTALPRNLNDYSLSKHQFKDWLDHCSKDMQVVHMRIEHMYGQGDGDQKFISWLINTLLHAKGSVELTDGTQQRDFIHIEDVVAAYQTVLSRLNTIGSWHELDVGSGNLITIKDLVLMVCDIIEECTGIQHKGRLMFGKIPYRSQELMTPELDYQRLLALGWQAHIPLKQGLTSIIRSSI